MSDPSVPPIHTWLAEPIPHAVAPAIERARRRAHGRDAGRAPANRRLHRCGDRNVAPDLPQAVGGDIGCGMLALGFDVEARALEDARIAGHILAGLRTTIGARACWDTAFATDHNHVSREHHEGRELWGHRKGAMPAVRDQAGVLPRSMGASSFHVEGRGNAAALCSSAHGAGRALSRAAARANVSERELRRQMDGVWFDYRLSGKLRDEALAAYKDITSVLRAQRESVAVTRVLRPVLNYKGV